MSQIWLRFQTFGNKSFQTFAGKLLSSGLVGPPPLNSKHPLGKHKTTSVFSGCSKTPTVRHPLSVSLTPAPPDTTVGQSVSQILCGGQWPGRCECVGVKTVPKATFQRVPKSAQSVSESSTLADSSLLASQSRNSVSQTVSTNAFALLSSESTSRAPGSWEIIG